MPTPMDVRDLPYAPVQMQLCDFIQIFRVPMPECIELLDASTRMLAYAAEGVKTLQSSQKVMC